MEWGMEGLRNSAQVMPEKEGRGRHAMDPDRDRIDLRQGEAGTAAAPRVRASRRQVSPSRCRSSAAPQSMLGLGPRR